eukprot:scaffold84537_cov42-Phaeocystis_antarctica.AAC.3
MAHDVLCLAASAVHLLTCSFIAAATFTSVSAATTAPSSALACSSLRQSLSARSPAFSARKAASSALSITTASIWAWTATALAAWLAPDAPTLARPLACIAALPYSPPGRGEERLAGERDVAAGVIGTSGSAVFGVVEAMGSSCAPCADSSSSNSEPGGAGAPGCDSSSSGCAASASDPHCRLASTQALHRRSSRLPLHIPTLNSDSASVMWHAWQTLERILLPRPPLCAILPLMSTCGACGDPVPSQTCRLFKHVGRQAAGKTGREQHMQRQ